MSTYTIERQLILYFVYIYSMSLNGPKSNAENQAVNAAVDKVIYNVYLGAFSYRHFLGYCCCSISRKLWDRWRFFLA